MYQPLKFQLYRCAIYSVASLPWSPKGGDIAALHNLLFNGLDEFQVIFIDFYGFLILCCLTL